MILRPAQQSPDTAPSTAREEALSWARVPRRFGSLLVAEHIVRAMRAYGLTLIVGGFTQPALYLLGLAVGLAALIRTPIDDGSGPVPYLVFVAPALLVSAVISVATEEFGYPVLAGFKWRRYFHGFTASPITPAQVANGLVIGVGVRMLVTATLYLAFVLVFFAVLEPNETTWATAWLALPISLFGGLAFGVPMLAYTASLEDDTGQLPLVFRLVFMPMFLFSGTFYPLANIGWLQWIGWISPLWHASELARWAMYGKPLGLALAAVHVGFLTACVAIGLVLARRTFTRRLTR